MALDALVSYLHIDELPKLEVFELVFCGGKLDLLNSDQVRCTTQVLLPFPVMKRWLNQNVFQKNFSFSSLFITTYSYNNKRLLQRPNICPEGITEGCHIFFRKCPETHTPTSLHQWVSSLFMSWQLGTPWVSFWGFGVFVCCCC